MWSKFFLTVISIVAVFRPGFCAINPDLCEGESNPSSTITWTDPPPIPAKYSAKVQIHSANSKQTINAEYAKNGLFGYIKYIQGGVVTTTIYDMERNQLILVSSQISSAVDSYCMVHELSDANGWELTKNVDKKLLVNGADWFLRFRSDSSIGGGVHAIDYGSKTERGVPVRQYVECLKWATEDMNANVISNWTDSTKWVMPNGKDKNKVISVPLSVSVKSSDGNLDEKAIDDYVVFYEFKQDFDEDIFKIPDGVYCANLKSKGIEIPNLPTFYSYDVEIILTQNKITKSKSVLYQKHLYDQPMKMNRLDSVPVPTEEILDPSKPHSHRSVMTQIHDFWSGIAYTFDNTGCSMSLIPNDTADVTVVNGNQVMISSPLKALGLGDAKFTYYKKGQIRGINAEQFRAFNQTEGRVTELWLSSAIDNIQSSTDEWLHRQPLRFSHYSIVDPFGVDRVDYNVLKFDPTEPGVWNYDVGVCYRGQEKRHFVFEFKGTLEQLNIQDKRGFKYQILLAIVLNALVTPIRVERIELDSRVDHTHVIFTLLEKKEFGNAADRAKDELTSDRAMDFFRSRLDSNEIHIGVPGSKIPVVDGIAGSLNEVDRLEENQVAPKAKATEYSKGAIIGASFGAFIFGIVLFALFFLFIKPKLNLKLNTGGDFEPKRFVNEPEPTLETIS